MSTARERAARGDHGSAEQAISWAVDHNPDGGIEAEAFLRCWREGDLDEWPEFYDWLDESALQDGGRDRG